ncbi:MAG: hypothetical protein NTV06_05180 [candidate division Zixibacteria bacterium]|nr:hypothetical protein [candidate division Zixibacteria bacterium]
MLVLSVITIEENSAFGGLGQMVAAYLATKSFKGKFHSFAIPDQFIQHGHRDILLSQIGLTVEDLVEYIGKLHSVRRTFLQKITGHKVDDSVLELDVVNHTGEKTSKKSTAGK